MNWAALSHSHGRAFVRSGAKSVVPRVPAKAVEPDTSSRHDSASEAATAANSLRIFDACFMFVTQR
ncbi:MAG: hypothetical protein AAFX94_17395, partial [Myxococcota bacterium]